MKKQKEVIIISLGGSLIVPNKINTLFLKKFKTLILSEIKKGKRFILICGGGYTARAYQKTAKYLTKLNHTELDWLGIHCTLLNAQLIKTIFSGTAHKNIVENPTKKLRFKKLLIACGWKPGCSTDYDAVLLARTFKAKTIINLSNITKAYTKDPKKYKSAKPITKTTWKEFRKIIGDKWIPGANYPFDPVASKLAEKLKLKTVIMKGTNLKNLKNYLDNKKFIGTTIE
ncbi:UMP kinase [Candidatus Woesearchaeota archaeon]|nr:UMP kinase [Candidatus Woesearchaeota archaeon]